MALERKTSDSLIRAVAEEANISNKPIRVLAVDDEQFNLEILVKHLKKAGFETIEAKNGEEAWEYLQKNPAGVDIILMDKMMPGINGVELTKKIKKDQKLKHIAVIMQTASVGTQAIVEGIEAGAYYYLTKPYAAEVLISIVAAAARDYRQQSAVADKAFEKKQILALIKKSEFEYKTIQDARSLAIYLASFCRDPARFAIGLAGLLVNAVEHGNLGIGYQKKLELLGERKLEEEIERRMKMPEFRDKKVTVKMLKEPEVVTINIIDEGNGFDPSPYLDFDPSRLTDPNGRGIAMARIMEGTSLQYVGKGNELICTIKTI
mgnify:CR=1 FL=1